MDLGRVSYVQGMLCTHGMLSNYVHNLVEEIEKDENMVIIGAAFIDFSPAYDTVNHRLMMKKIYEVIVDMKSVINY